MFRTVSLSNISSFSLYTQQWCMSYRFADSLQAGMDGTSWSYSQAVRKPIWLVPLLYVQWKTPDDGQKNCPKHVEFYSKNKVGKLVHLIGVIIRIYHDVRSSESQFLNVGPYRAPLDNFIVDQNVGVNFVLSSTTDGLRKRLRRSSHSGTS